jgi:hypothetical protein
MKNIYGSIAFLVASNTYLIGRLASIRLTFPNLPYISTTGFEISLKALSLFFKVSSLSSSLYSVEVPALIMHLSSKVSSLTS